MLCGVYGGEQTAAAGVAPDPWTALLHPALADAWEIEGALREGDGGGATRVQGLRLVASGLSVRWLNAADASAGEEGADLPAARAFFAARGLPWGVRVPEGVAWRSGRLVHRLRLMGVRAGDLRPARSVAGVALRTATPADLEPVAAVDCAAFGGDPAGAVPWLAPHLRSPAIAVALAWHDGAPIATAYAIRTEGDAGPAALLGGVAVVPAARRRGVGAWVSSWLVERAFDAGARLAALQADDEPAARVYRRLGFRDGGVLRVFTDV